jgi:hypothetical protein
MTEETKTAVNVADMLAICAFKNREPIWITKSRWYFVRPADPATGQSPQIAFVEGMRADHARMASDGEPFQAFVPEPGEADWIHRATAKYRARFPTHDALGADRQNFLDTLNRAAVGKPWRQTGDVAA